ncbi:MAG: OmpH family outer membrane protein [Flavobacteriales bacterium]|nr:OmpH family outer membrane protein [Flavobacteriales bacterium]
MKQFNLIMVAVLLTLGTALSAQDKFGHLNSQELLQLMPEGAEAEQKLQSLNTQLEERLRVLMGEYQSEVQAFQGLAEDTPATTANDMRDGILDMEKRIQDFQANAEQDLATKQQELLTPMLEKMQKAIEDVGKENGYLYIFDISTGAVVYTGGEDVSQLVKTKLGITG